MSEDDARAFEGLDVAVVLPTLNEEHGLARTLDAIPFDSIRRGGWTVRPVVMDGGSTDGTLAVARERGIPILNQSSRGKGAAVREALSWLENRGVQYAVILDADCTYPGAMVPAFVELLDAGSQLVVGVRQPVTPAKDNPREFVHRVGNRILNLAASQLASLPILDLCSGFWAVQLSSVPPLNLETNGFEIEAELFTKAYRAGYMVTQIPISYHERVGVAKLRALRDGARILLTALRFGRQRPRFSLVGTGPTQVRDILSIALVHGGNEFVILSDISRRADAEHIAERIRASRPASRLTVRVVPPLSDLGALPAGRLSPWPSDARAVTIALPALAGVGVDLPPSALVHLPTTGRLVAITPTGRFSRASVEGFPGHGFFESESMGYELEYAPEQWSGAVDRVRALVANTFPTERAKEIAFLGANGHYGSLSVWRSAAWRAPSESMASVPAGASSDPRREPAESLLADDGSA